MFGLIGGRLNLDGGRALFRPDPPFGGAKDDNLVEGPLDDGGGRPCLFGPILDRRGGNRLLGLCGGLLCC